MKKEILFLIGALLFLPKTVVHAAIYSNFSDNNFYKCVVDSYNTEQNATVSYSEQLTDQQLSTIKILHCEHRDDNDSAKIRSIEENSLTSVNLNNLTNVWYLTLSYNQLTE